MGNYFLDSSAIIKRYVTEIGSAWIQGIADPQSGNSLFISRITRIEVFSAFGRRQREGSLLTSDVDQLIQLFRHDLSTQYQVIEVDEALTQVAENLTVQYPLRAYDAVQLASAIFCQSLVTQNQEYPEFLFLTADDRLLNVAQSEGVACDNPNQYL